MKSLLAFVAMLAVDALWAAYIMAASDRAAGKAALCSGGIVLCSAVVTLLYVESAWTLIPASLGAVAGTWWTIRHG